MRRILKLSVLCFYFCFCATNLSAQKVAGYMGKRVFVGIPISYMPNIYGFVNESANINYQGKSQFYMIHAPKIGGSIGLVTSNLRSWVLDVDFQNIGVLSNSEIDYNPYPSPPNFAYGRSRLTTYKIRIQNAHQHCAPVGGYKGMTFGLTTFNNSYFNEQGSEIAAENTLDFSIGYGGGLRRVYKDKIVLDLGLEYNMYIKAIGSIFDFDSMDKALNESVGDYAIKKNGLNSIIVCKAAIYLLL